MSRRKIKKNALKPSLPRRLHEQTGLPIIRRKRRPPIRVRQTQSAFIRPDTETLSVIAVCTDNPDRSPFTIHG